MSLENLQYREVEASAINKSLEVPSSKSYANRALILAAIAKKDITLENLPKSTDVLTMLSLLSKIGLKVIEKNNCHIIKGSFPECETNLDSPLILDTGDGGTTNRFIIGLLARGKREYIIEPSSHMRNRPMEEIEGSLGKLGVKIVRNEQKWFSLKGPILETKVEVDCSRSTQFATSLYLACSGMSVDIELKNLDASKKYFEMTEKIIKDFCGIDSYQVPLDASSLSYPLALAAVTGKVEITNYSGRDPFQADDILTDLLKEMGANVEASKGSLKVEKNILTGIDIDCSGFPDLVPTLGYLCSFAEGESVLRNLEVLRHKESDRVNEMIRVLKAFKVKFELLDGDDLRILGKEPLLEKVKFSPPPDHRIVMMAYLFMRTCGGGSLSNDFHVKKSFPNFFEAMS